MTKEALLGVAAARRYAKDGTGREIRKRARLSMREVAATIGVSSPTLSNWEIGLTAPHGGPAVKWAELLGALVEQECIAATEAAKAA
ncbi:helix-turn-helix transcriptional regulator [Dactylosporangium salmoneum]|uniref:HTH cro/C1-type domain-containing protein n=1 Tax=Dactylosporangium salmoneum TaxID=53361 RepID=A0ABP5TBI7_9ACTN